MDTPFRVCALALASSLVFACSSSSGGGTTDPDEDSGVHTPDAGSAPADASPSSQDSGGSGADSAVSCPGAPTLYPDTATEEYCLHNSADMTIYCTLPSEVCCLGANDTSICAAPGTACPAPLATLNCTDDAECGFGEVCCGAGPRPALDAACGYFTETGLTSSTCISGNACPAGLFELCGSTADCATCTPFRHSSGDNLGFCN